MKKIRPLPGPTPGLAAYRAEPWHDKDWAGFRSYRGSSLAYWELADALEARQHGLCGYCEVQLAPPNRQVEHVLPQSKYPQHALDHANLMACCRGVGSPMSGSEPDERTRRKRGPHASCGSAKGDEPPNELLDPRKLPHSPSVFRVLDDGQIEADLEACEKVGMDSSLVQATIDVLGLNVPRLCTVREQIWSALRDSIGEEILDEELVRARAEQALLPDEADRLPAYFTTARSFYETRTDAVSDILSASPQRWI